MSISYVCDRCGFPVLRNSEGCWVHASAGDAAFCAAFAGVGLTPSADLPACRDEADLWPDVLPGEGNHFYEEGIPSHE